MATTSGRTETSAGTAPSGEPSDAIASALERLASDGLVVLADDGWRTTLRLEGAIARAMACIALTEPAAQGAIDARRPLALALIALYGPDTADAIVADMIEALLPIEPAAP
jgi:hypothetical protein